MGNTQKNKVLKELRSLKKESLVTTVSDYVQQFSSHMNSGIESILKAAKTYAMALISHPNTAQAAFEDAYPSVSKEMWERLAKIGNGDVHPRAVLVSDSFARKIEKLSVKQQNAIFSSAKGFEVYDVKRRKVEVVPFAKITTSMEKMIFDEKAGRIRTANEQKEYCDELNRKNGVDEGDRYVILGKVVKFKKNATFGIGELKAILAHLDGTEVIR